MRTQSNIHAAKTGYYRVTQKIIWLILKYNICVKPFAPLHSARKRKEEKIKKVSIFMHCCSFSFFSLVADGLITDKSSILKITYSIQSILATF